MHDVEILGALYSESAAKTSSVTVSFSTKAILVRGVCISKSYQKQDHRRLLEEGGVLFPIYAKTKLNKVTHPHQRVARARMRVNKASQSMLRKRCTEKRWPPREGRRGRKGGKVKRENRNILTRFRNIIYDVNPG